MTNAYSSLFDSLQNGATVVTPNNRLALELQTRYLHHSEQTVIEKPRCLSYQAFVQNLLHSLIQSQPQTSHPLVLSAQQTRWLWRQTVEQILGQAANSGLIQQIATAWQHCLQWQIDFNDPAFALTAQTRLLQRFALDLETKLANYNAITVDGIVTYLLGFDCLSVSEQVIWICFDDFTPQQRALQAHFEAQGKTNQFLTPALLQANVEIFAAKDDKEETAQLFLWLSQQLKQGQEHIGVVIPDLQNRAKSLQRQLRQQFEPWQYNLSLGLPLNEYAIVAHGLRWLELSPTNLTRHQACCLLRSPFLADSQQEMLARATLLQESKSLLETTPSPRQFSAELKIKAPLLAERFASMTTYPEQATPKDWVGHFIERLISLGYPGECRLNSAAYQCYQRLLLLLDEFRQLEAVTEQMTAATALATLKEMAQTTVFQPKKQDKAPVHIMGLLEAAGTHFDSLWVTGLTDECLPQKTQLNAFIPKSLQQERQMPHALPKRELELAHITIQRLSQSAQRVVFSYPSLCQDKPNLPSPLLKPFTSEHQPLQARPATLAPVLVNCHENYALPLLEEESPSGGTALLANQAKCPFRAFAAHRLHARAPLAGSDGPNALERGNMVHCLMEKIWQRYKNQHTLLHAPLEDIENTINQAIQSTLLPLTQSRPSSFPALIQQVEQQRLKRLVYAVLEWEKQRPAFEVEGLEKSYTYTLAGLAIRVRVDRLDCLEDGSKWVIDYKTSIPPGTPWLEDRPTEPQLLLYTFLDEQINALLFAELKNGQLKLKGLSADATEQPGIKALKKDQSWKETRESWHYNLKALAEEFVNGHCPPQPVKPSVCQNCDYGDLCRYSVQDDA